MGNKQKIVIVGAGFGGLNLVKRLDKNLWDIVISTGTITIHFLHCSIK